MPPPRPSAAARLPRWHGRGLFLAVLAGREPRWASAWIAATRAWRALVMVAGLLVILLGGLRLSFLATAGTSPVPAITGACLFMVATAGFLALGYRALLVAETPPAWRAQAPGMQGGSGHADGPGPRPAKTSPKGPSRSTPTSGMSSDRYARPAFPDSSWQWSPASGSACWGDVARESWKDLVPVAGAAAAGAGLTGLRTGSWITRWIPAR